MSRILSLSALSPRSGSRGVTMVVGGVVLLLRYLVGKHRVEMPPIPEGALLLLLFGVAAALTSDVVTVIVIGHDYASTLLILILIIFIIILGDEHGDLSVVGAIEGIVKGPGCGGGCVVAVSGVVEGIRGAHFVWAISVISFTHLLLLLLLIPLPFRLIHPEHLQHHPAKS